MSETNRSPLALDDDFIEEVEDLLLDGRAAFARETLTGILQSLREGQPVTDGRRRAVANIKTSAQGTDALPDEGGTRLPSDRFRGSRRYEGA